MNYLPNDFSFPVSLGIFGMKLPFKKHQLNLQTSTGPSWCLFPYYFSLCERILRGVREGLRLVVGNIAHAEELEDLEQELAVVAEGDRTVVRVALLDEHMTVEAAHLRDGEDADAAEAHRLRDDAQRDRIHDPIEGAPVGSKPIEVLAVRAAVYLGVVRDAAIPRRDLQLNAQHIPDALELVYELQIDHLGVALLALAFKFIPGKILRQRGFVPALIGYNAHTKSLLSVMGHKKSWLSSSSSYTRLMLSMAWTHFPFGKFLCFWQ